MSIFVEEGGGRKRRRGFLQVVAGLHDNEQAETGWVGVMGDGIAFGDQFSNLFELKFRYLRLIFLST